MCKGWSWAVQRWSSSSLPALPLSAHINLAVLGEVKEPLGQYGPLDGEGHDEEAASHAAHPIAAEEGQ